jgi:hypothetical protein
MRVKRCHEWHIIQSSDMVVMINRQTVAEVDLKRLSEILKNKTTGKNIITDEKISISKEFTIPPKSSVVLDIE